MTSMTMTGMTGEVADACERLGMAVGGDMPLRTQMGWPRRASKASRRRSVA